MLEADQLACVRGDRPLFRRLNFSLAAGAALHVAGANGSGKTSLLRLLCGLSAPAEGDVRWNGENIRSLREEFYRDLVYIGHAPAVKDDLSPVENLMTSATLSGGSVAAEEARGALQRIGLAGREDLPTKVLSQGQRRRVALARLLLSSRVPLWVLDEPFTALDKRAVDSLRQTIEAHIQDGGMVIYTTHQEVEFEATKARRLDLDEVAT
ncbi:MAG: ccmA [Proteobacteria bacterium]|jgi:heme exporter protein A|nr:ccmA [Pseudomonadota bacterium]